MAADADPRRQLGKIALQQKRVAPGNHAASVAEFLRALGEEHGAPPIDLTEQVIPATALRLVPVEIALERVAVPFALDADEVKVAMAAPRHAEAVMEIEFLAAKRVVPHVAPEVVVRHVIEHAYAALDRGADCFVGSGVTPERLAELGVTGVDPSPPPPEFLPPPAPIVPATIKEEAEKRASDPRVDPVTLLPQPAPVLKPPPPAGAQATARTNEPDGSKPTTDATTTRKVESRAVVAGATVVTAPAATATAALGTVLLAISDRERRRAIERALGAEGATVIEADDGAKALAMARDRTPKLCVLDQDLATTSGLEVARKLQADGKPVAVILLSESLRGWRIAEDLREHYGVKHLCEAPVDAVKLVRMVRLELEGKPVPPPPPALSPEAEARWSAGIAAFEKGEIERAIAEMEAGVTIDPDAFEMHYHLGLLHGRREELFAAIRALDRAVELQPKSFAALKNLAVVCQRAGLRRRARDSWERALSAAPDDATAATIKQHIASSLL
jgi:CheY-like chemotaxis protein